MEKDQLGVRVDNNEIVSRKCPTEDLVVQPKAKLTRLENELKESKAKLRDATNQVESAKKLSQYVRLLNSKTCT